MKTTKNVIGLGLILTGLLLPQLSNAQKITQKNTTIIISGTSPMHDWEMKSATSTFTGLVAGNAITNVSLTVPVKTLSAEKGKIMEKKAYEALKSDKAPKASVQQEFHCWLFEPNETLVISGSFFIGIDLSI